MKKYFVLAAAAAFALLACEQTTPDVDGSGTGNGGGNNNQQSQFETVILNELCGNKVYDGAKFIELYNPTSTEQDIAGWTLRKYAPDATDVAGKYNVCWTAPAGTKLAAGAYLVLKSDQTDPTLGFNAGLSAKKGLKFELVDASGKVVDLFLRGKDADPFGEEALAENKEASFSRVPNGGATWAYAEPTPGEANGDFKGEIEME